MTSTIKYVLTLAVIGAALGTIAFFGLSPFFKAHEDALSASPTGTTFTTAKVAQINMAPVNSATSSSILNTDANNRYITDGFVACSGATTTYTAVTGAGLASWGIKAATTSSSAPAVTGNTNFALNALIATGTTAAGTAGFPIVIVASSSVSTSSPNPFNVANAYQFVWASGSYLTFFFNATSTALCTVGVHYLGS